ncbi:Histone acetyltransferase [Fusarium oxysporum f. sp. albedinis]|nr:Histone acetyltransferase [Fusarium oxysporum f. sp. albedinis]
MSSLCPHAQAPFRTAPQPSRAQHNRREAQSSPAQLISLDVKHSSSAIIFHYSQLSPLACLTGSQTSYWLDNFRSGPHRKPHPRYVCPLEPLLNLTLRSRRCLLLLQCTHPFFDAFCKPSSNSKIQKQEPHRVYAASYHLPSRCTTTYAAKSTVLHRTRLHSHEHKQPPCLVSSRSDYVFPFSNKHQRPLSLCSLLVENLTHLTIAHSYFTTYPWHKPQQPVQKQVTAEKREKIQSKTYPNKSMPLNACVGSIAHPAARMHAYSSSQPLRSSSHSALLQNLSIWTCTHALSQRKVVFGIGKERPDPTRPARPSPASPPKALPLH